MFSAQLRLPSNMTTAEKSQRVDDIIEELVRPPALPARGGHATPGSPALLSGNTLLMLLLLNGRKKTEPSVRDAHPGWTGPASIT